MPKFDIYQEEFHPSPLIHTWWEFRKSHVAVLGLWILAFFVFLVVFGPIIAPFDPVLQNPNAFLVKPSWDVNGSIRYLFGTDSLGRDLLSRLIYGCRMTLGISLLLVLLAMLVGVALGAMAGLTRGVRSSVLNHLLDSILAIPTLLIAIVIVGILGVGLVNSMWAISLALIPQFVHNTREVVRTEMAKEYILASKLDGAKNTYLFFYCILPNMYEMLVVQGTMALSIAILDISALGFLGLGAQAPAPELGTMLSEGLRVAYKSPWSIALPGCAIFLMVLSVNVVGDGLRSALRNRLQR
ncbi:ABC transporter permease subunit [Aliiglaciecola sp. 3_MG-2023]|uniref:ABC transporter permease subunit n=1 Tax=Aliiglaciecola sp. 3_MG-2023 TaxID=3062644 RepID=UPI0026E12E26|nr:ABC transporter permease subunit [Aliiglaciecola sp. 3_MG-2023]MDO6695763.1 ABC transporter permease subunit [Aliiglaciecola sp. 3_MG-2023]